MDTRIRFSVLKCKKQKKKIQTLFIRWLPTLGEASQWERNFTPPASCSPPVRSPSITASSAAYVHIFFVIDISFSLPLNGMTWPHLTNKQSATVTIPLTESYKTTNSQKWKEGRSGKMSFWAFLSLSRKFMWVLQKPFRHLDIWQSFLNFEKFCYKFFFLIKLKSRFTLWMIPVI